MMQPSFFVIGMPRSGTKLLRELLNNHSQIFIPGVETLFVPKLIREYGGRELTESDFKQIVDEVNTSLLAFYYSFHSDFSYLPVFYKGMNVCNLLDSFYQYLSEIQGSSAPYIGDKSPNYISHIHLLVDFFPEARFIHIVRDPRDHAISLKKAWNKSMIRSAVRWVEGVSQVQAVIEHNSDRIHEIRYEDLISAPEEILRGCASFLGLKFESGLAELKHSVENFGDAKKAHVYKHNKLKWKKKLSPSLIENIEQITVEQLKGYQYDYTTKSISNKSVSALMLSVYKFWDALNLIRFNFREHGVRYGFEKIIRASKA